MKLVVIIPAYNEELTIGDVVRSIPVKLKGIKKIAIVVVDDGSIDRTVELGRQAGAIVISHAHNRGVGGAFRTGLMASLDMGADVMVNIDADNQFSPKDISLLIAPIINKQADFVSGDRFTNPQGKLRKPQHMSSLKYWGNQCMSKLIGLLSETDFADVSCGFRAYSKEALLRLNLLGKFTYTQESFLDLANKGLKIASVPVDVRYFPERRSRLSGNILNYMVRTAMIILRVNRDHKPMEFFGWLGLIPFVIGLGCGIYTGIHYINTGSFTPYKFVGFAGIYFITLGLLIWIVGIVADMFVRVRLNEELLLYYEKKRLYDRS